MNLDWTTCSKARLSRDPRFDGKFFIGVLTSGVYCRNICPARTAKEENVRYFATAAAASEAGFRPCLRCRPECSPGTPAWHGTSSTVSRALRLIDERLLEEESVEVLAQRLGISSRHLRRLFLKHLGASPSTVAHTRRLQFAKKLIDETDLRMGYVAVAAGFGCVRRFNEAIRATYNRTPTHIRKLARHSASSDRDSYSFRVAVRPPYQWDRLLAYLAARATPGVEVVTTDSYRRTISLDGSDGSFEVSFDAVKQVLNIRIQFERPHALFGIMGRIKAIFDVDADPETIDTALESDPLLRQRVRSQRGTRVAGCWDGFELAVRAIVGQQISVKGATTLAGRIAAMFGHSTGADTGPDVVFPTPQVLATAQIEKVGLTTARASSIRALARAVFEKKLVLDGTAPQDETMAALQELPGIGAWTAQYIAMRALRDPDAFPAGDLGLLNAAGADKPVTLERRAEAWRPWRAYAAMYLWTAKSNMVAMPEYEIRRTA